MVKRVLDISCILLLKISHAAIDQSSLCFRNLFPPRFKMASEKTKLAMEERARSGLRRESMRSFEGDSPPPYSSQPPSIYSPDGNTSDRLGPALQNLNFEPSALELPTTAECITHLRLLHAFAKMRHEVGNRDGLYGITMEKAGDVKSGDEKDAKATGAQAQENSTNSDAAFAERIRDKRWTVFVHKAVDRFEAWWNSLPAHSSSIWRSPIKMQDFNSTLKAPFHGVGFLIVRGIAEAERGTVAEFPVAGDGLERNPEFRLPPLDVLMVWHAFMLNPRTYLEDCIRFTKHALWRTSFPWQAISASIDEETYDYIQDDPVLFQKITGRQGDPLMDEELKKITCPKCTTAATVPWTMPPAASGQDALELYLSNDPGFTGSGFQVDCQNCGFTITHEKLRVGKFIDDASSVLIDQRPLSGTILSRYGDPRCALHGKNLLSHDPFFPNRAVEIYPDLRPTALRENIQTLTVDGLKTLFQQLIDSPDDVALVNAAQFQPTFLALDSKISVRRLLSHYWDNSSVFGIDLVGAVLRQGTFVQKMRKLDWLHSPSLMSTTQRLIIKYHRYVRIAAEAVKKSVVPTLDIDLGWVSFTSKIPV